MNNSRKIIKKLAKEIVKRGMSAPAIFFLESTKYVSFIGSQFLVFLGPISTMFINDKKYYQFINLIEKKENIEYLIIQIENIQLNFKNKVS